MSFEVSTTIGTRATARVGAQPLDDLEAVDVRHQQVERARPPGCSRGRARTPSSPPAARSTGPARAARASPRRGRDRAGRRRSRPPCAVAARRDAARQRGERARLRLDRLDEVLRRAEREARRRARRASRRSRPGWPPSPGRALSRASSSQPSSRGSRMSRMTAAGCELARQLEALVAVARRRDRVAGVLEVDLQQVGRAAVVLDDEHVPRRRRPALACLGAAGRRRGAGVARDRERERAAVAELGSPSRCGRRAARRSAARASGRGRCPPCSSATPRPPRWKASKMRSLLVLGDADARCRARDHDHVAARRARVDRDRAAVRRELDRVADEVDDDLLELELVGRAPCPRPAATSSVERDALRAGALAQHRDARARAASAARPAPRSSSIRPASIFERSRISLISSSRCRPESRMSRTYSSWRSLSSPNIRSSSTSEKPITALSGVRSSCDMLGQELRLVAARDLELLASCARARGTRARCGSPAPTGSASVSSSSTRLRRQRAGRAGGGRRARRGSRARCAAGRRPSSASRPARSASMCASGGSQRRGRSPAAPRRRSAARPMNVSSRRIVISRSACTSSVARAVARAQRELLAPAARARRSSRRRRRTARRRASTIVVSTSSTSRLELTAWLTSPSARSSSTERASSRCALEVAGRAARSGSRSRPAPRTSSTSPIVARRRTARRPPATARSRRRRWSSASIGTPSSVRKPPSSQRLVPAGTRVARASAIWTVRRSSADAARPASRAGGRPDAPRGRRGTRPSRRAPAPCGRRRRRAARPAAVSAAQVHGVAHDGLEHRLQLEVRAPDRLQHLGSSPRCCSTASARSRGEPIALARRRQLGSGETSGSTSGVPVVVPERAAAELARA